MSTPYELNRSSRSRPATTLSIAKRHALSNSGSFLVTSNTVTSPFVHQSLVTCLAFTQRIVEPDATRSIFTPRLSTDYQQQTFATPAFSAFFNDLCKALYSTAYYKSSSIDDKHIH